jgi:Fe(3+) dicitrate transport protein
MKYFVIILVVMVSNIVSSQQGKLAGELYDSQRESIPGVRVWNKTVDKKTRSNINGIFVIPADVGDSIQMSYVLFDTILLVVDQDMLDEGVDLKMTYKTQEVEEVEIIQKRLADFDVGFLPPIKGVRLNNGTNSIIKLKEMGGAKSTGNAREMYGKIPGLNIWENDGAGIQVGIGGRGLSPKRTANFNTRQNGYDISADALGYPESYYTPPIEALDNIEIVRGSAALQFGTQFGGLLNFVIRDPVDYSPFEFTTRNTVGGYGYLSTFNRVSGSHKRMYYQAYHLYKRGDGYRENSEFYQHQAFAQFGYYLNEDWTVGVEFTHMNYLSQQPGGLTDLGFEEDPRQSIRDRNWFGVDWNLLAITSNYDFKNGGRLDFRAFGMISNRKSLGFLGKVTQTDDGGAREMIYSDFQNMGAEIRYLKKYTIQSATSEKSGIRGAFVVGGRLYQGETTTEQGSAAFGDDADFSFLNPDDLETSSFIYPSQNAASFLENIFFLGSKWRINLGARLEHISSSSDGFYKRYSIHPINNDTLQTTTVRDENEVVRTVPLFGFGSSYKVDKNSTAYVNVTQNYRAINFTDIRVNNPNVQVDTNIRDEYGFTAEMGVRGLVKDFMIYDVSAFYIFYGDKIGLAPVPNSIRKQRTNIGDAQNYGLESFVEIDWIKAFSDKSTWEIKTFLNASFIDANYITSKEANFVGNRVEYVSRYMVRSGLSVGKERWGVKFQFNYNSAQFSDASNAVEPSGDAVIGLVPEYVVFDFSGFYKFKKYFQVEFGVNNFTNQKYFTRRATGYPGPGILPSDGINPYVTLQFQLAK